MPFRSTAPGAVQPSWLHGACPSLPQAPPAQPPNTHRPRLAPHEAPLAIHTLLFWSQQPPAAQPLPSQQGCPGPPQVAHLPPALHARPEPVQKALPPACAAQQF